MMTLVGLLLMLGGGVLTYLAFSGNMPEQVAALPIPPWVYLILAVVGALMMFLNRRPGD